MPASVGTVNKQYVSILDLMDVREIKKGVIDVHQDAQFADLIKIMGRYTPTSMPWYSQHYRENLIGIGSTVGQTITGSGTPTLTVPLTAATSGQFRIGDLVRLINGKVGRIQNVVSAAADTLTIKSVDNTNLTFVAGNPVIWIGMAGQEAGTSRSPMRHRTVTAYNHVQIFWDTVSETDINRMSATEQVGKDGKNFIAYLAHQSAIDTINLAVSGTAFAGQLSGTKFSDATPTLPGESGGYGVQTTMGVDQYVDTKGFKRNLTTLGTVTIGDIAAFQDLALAAKAGKKFMVMGSTAAQRPFVNYLKNLGSGGLAPVRLNIDGRAVDLNVEQWMYSGFSYEFMPLQGFDNPNMFPAGVSDISKNLYYIPKDNVALVGGGNAPRFGMRYLDNKGKLGVGGPNVKWSDLIMEQWDGGLAPNPTSAVRVGNCTFTTYQGVEILGAEHFGRETVLA